MNFSVNPKKTTETSNFSIPQEVSPPHNPSVRLSLEETNQTALEAGITTSSKSNLQGSTSSSKLTTTEQASFFQTPAKSLIKMLQKVKETLSKIKHSLTDTAEVKSLRAHVRVTNNRIAKLKESRENFLGDIREQERLKEKSTPSVRGTLTRKMTDFKGKIDEIDEHISKLYAEKERHQSEIHEVRRTGGSASSSQKPSDKLIKEPQAITPNNIFKILRQLTSNYEGGIVEDLYKTYGPKITNSNYLLSQINQISDKNQRNMAMKYFLTYQTSMIGHNLGIGGSLKLKTQVINSLTSLARTIKNSIYERILKMNPPYSVLKSQRVELEGQWQTNTHLKITGSLHQFFSENSVGKAMPEEDKKAILNAFENSLSMDESPESIQRTLQDIQEGKLVTIPAGWFGHATEITIKGNYLCYSNRGQRSKEWSEGGAGIQVYKMTKPMTPEILLKIITNKTALAFKEGSSFLENPNNSEGLIASLGLKPQGNRIEKKEQKVGNCAWASTKCAFQAAIMLLELERLRPKKMQQLGVLLDKATLNQLTDSDKTLLFKACVSNPEGSNIMQELDNTDSLAEKLNKDPSFRKHLLEHFEKKINSGYEIIDIALEKFSAWNMEHRAAECAFFIDLIREENTNEEFISKSEELKLLGQLASKFYSAPVQKKYNKIEEDAGKRLHEMTNSILFEKNYSVQDCIIKIDSDDPSKIEEIAKRSLARQPQGGFLIFEDMNGHIRLFVKKQKEISNFEVRRESSSFIIQDEKGENHTLNSFSHIVDLVKNLGFYNAFFVHNAKDIERVLHPKDNLD